MIQAFIDFLAYFFTINPSKYFPLQNIIWGILILNLLVAILILVKLRLSKEKPLKKLLQNFPGTLLSIEALLAINIFSRLNRVEVFSMRFFTFLLLAWLLFTYIKVGLAIFKEYPKKLKEAEQKHPGQGRFHIIQNKKRHN